METLAITNLEFTFIQLTGFLVSEVWIIQANEEIYKGEIIVSLN